jgi:beta-mannosidase
LTSVELCREWQLACTEPDRNPDCRQLDGLAWLPAQVPGTAASALREAGLWSVGQEDDFDHRDWWFRTSFDALPAAEREELALSLDGVATVAEVYLNGDRVLESESMFAAHEIPLTESGRGSHELVIRCRALGPLLQRPRRPRARWRTRLVSEGNLRFYRTMLLGRAPGFASGPPAIGPWKPVRLERRRDFAVDELRVRTALDHSVGKVAARTRLRTMAGAPPPERMWLEVSGPNGTRRAEFELDVAGAGVSGRCALSIPSVELWWPHTHGTPALHQVSMVVELPDREVRIDAGPIGFRKLSAPADIERDGLSLKVNGVAVFARGAVWTPIDLLRPCSSREALASVLGAVVDSGMNMLRVPGIGCYESDAFYDLCDELGILLWHDFMFANLDYPEFDAGFVNAVKAEVRQVLAGLAPRPSLAVLCGSSEVAQQVSMLGLDAQLANGPLYRELLPSLIADAEVDAPYVPSTPCGGDLPFRPGRGIANYYGVGAYRRPLQDVRRSEVRFAAECLAFSNVPEEDALADLCAPGGSAVTHSRWKAGVPRDVGAGWDFEDVRDHYLQQLYGLDPIALRSVDPERYLELSRFLTGEVMAEVFGEWRRPGSTCHGALVLWLTDVVPGAGWGLLDHQARPKIALAHLRRALAPVAVWSTDEGLGGVVAHVANDRSSPLRATLRVALYRDLELAIEQAERPVSLEGHNGVSLNVEELIGRFVDASWAYRFGPPSHDLIVLSLEHRTADGAELLSQSFRFAEGRPIRPESAERLGFTAELRPAGDAAPRVVVSSRRFAYGIRVRVPGFRAREDAFSLEPGRRREIELHPVGPETAPAGGQVTALNLAGRVSLPRESAV